MKTALSLYENKVMLGEIERDEAQVAVIERLDLLIDAFNHTRLSPIGRTLGRLFGSRKSEEHNKGLYIWGDVGRGKTMLMDIVFSCVNVPVRRVHFHAFMADIHERIFAFRQHVKRGEVKDTDPMPIVAAQIADETLLLCFDEFMVRDIADAMILARLFTHLFAKGVVVVATSNVEPSRLYEGGLNRALFMPFLALLMQNVDVMHLDARTDFRLEKLGNEPVYYHTLDENTHASMNQLFIKLSGGGQAQSVYLKVKGRDLAVPFAKDGVARFTFAQLCVQPLGASDYLAIAQKFHTVFVENIPIMHAENRNEAKRFMILIDALYDNHVKVIASAQAEPLALYTAQFGAEAFEFARTVSRLMEMRSADYLALPHGRIDSRASGNTTGLVET